MASPEQKRCYYEILGLSRDCTPDEIRSAYKKLALQRHPDKLVQSGVAEPEARAAFQELVNAYEVLSDPRERAWYDSHRNQILFSDSASKPGGGGSVPDLFGFFSNSVYSGYSDTGRGFYKVYGDLFEKIYSSEFNYAKQLGLPLPKQAPLMGNLDSPYVQVTAFYNYWLGFTTSMEFFWVDQYDAMAGPNRKSRRVMEEENKKLRKKARREYNETVRGLAEFVKKRDKRVIDMQVKRNEEMEKKKEEERRRKKELERQKMEKARTYEEPEWAKVEEFEDEDVEDVVEEDTRKKELYCVVCGKKFKSEKQWINHEKSKKHKEKVAELREAFGEEDKECEKRDLKESQEELEEVSVDRSNYLSGEDEVDELSKQFEDDVDIQEEEDDEEKAASPVEDGFVDSDDVSGSKGVGIELGSDNDEAGILEAMVSGHMTKNKANSRHKPKAPAKKVQVQVEIDEMDFTEYNDMKGSRKNGKSRRRRNGKQKEEETIGAEQRSGEQEEEETMGAGTVEADDVVEECDRNVDCHFQESTSHTMPESENDRENIASERGNKLSKQTVNNRRKQSNDNTSFSKAAPKGRKQKASSKAPGNVCEKCGEEFESRNRLHKHLGDTGHASLKSR